MWLLLSVTLSVCVSWAHGADPPTETLPPDTERNVDAQPWELEDLPDFFKPRYRENARRRGQFPPRTFFPYGRLPPPPMFTEHCCMPVFENAVAVITGKPFQLNDRLEYTCLDGYENRDGNTTGSMVCGKDGWTHLPTCFKSTEKCGRPPAISNGDVTSFLSETYPPGSRVEYQCQAYYELEGSPSVTCSDAKWSEPPRCIAPCVITEENMTKNKIRLKWKDHKRHYSKTGDFVEFTCASGHHAMTSQVSFRALCQDGTMEFPKCE